MTGNSNKQVGKFSESQQLRSEVLKKSSQLEDLKSELPSNVVPNYRFNPYNGVTMNGDFGKVDHIDTWSGNWSNKGQP